MKRVLELLHNRIDELVIMLTVIEVMLQDDIDKANRDRMKEEIQKLLSK